MRNPSNQYTFLRLFLPLLLGGVVYGLLLLMFDRIESVQDNFLTYEFLFCIICTYAWSEVMIFPWRKLLSGNNNIVEERVCIHCNLLWLLLSLIVVLTLVILNFYHIVGYSQLSSFKSELMAFIGIYSVLSIFYFVWLYGTYLIRSDFQIQLDSEKGTQEDILNDWKKQLNIFRPQLLFDSLESLICISYDSKEQAEKLAETLADVYRYIWKNAKEEMVPLSAEIASLIHLEKLLKENAEQQFSLKIDIDEASMLYKSVVPSTLLQILECVYRTSIINKRKKMVVQCYLEEEYLCFEHSTNDKLYDGDTNCKLLINDLEKLYYYWTSLHVVQLKAYSKTITKIPLIQTT